MNLKTLCRYLSIILKYPINSGRFILFIFAFIFIIIFILHNSKDQVIGHNYKNTSNDLVNNRSRTDYKNISRKFIKNRLRTHARFFAESSSSCHKSTGTASVEQQQHFDKIAQALAEFRQQSIPSYSDDNFNGRGIVLSVGPLQIYQCKVNLKMIERTQTRLPVQVWYSSSELDVRLINELLNYAPKLDLSLCSFTMAQCRSLRNTWKVNTSYVFSPTNKRGQSNKHFPYKPAAIISATFNEVLFLDSDSYLVRDPEYLFQFDPMYLRFGALFYPDALISGQHPIVWNLLNTTCRPDEPEFDSGAILVNKKRVWNALYLTKLMNDRHELFYKSFSGGDKDTFRWAFRFLRVEYYMAGVLCSTGHYNGTHFCGFTMCKTDSLGKHIFINHLSLMKYVNAGYSKSHLGYTRIGLADPYNHSFYMQYCPYYYANSCLFIDTHVNKSQSINRCLNRPIDRSEIDNHAYGFNESLISMQFENHRMLMSETNNLMPGFIDSLFYYRRQVYGNKWTKSLEE